MYVYTHAYEHTCIHQFDEANKQRKGVATKTLHGNERALLCWFIAKLHQTDVDVIVGHNFLGFDLDVLLHRLQRLKIHDWSKLGRLRRTVWPKLQVCSMHVTGQKLDVCAALCGPSWSSAPHWAV